MVGVSGDGTILEVFCWIVVFYSREEKTGCQKSNTRLNLRLLYPVHQEAVDKDTEVFLVLVTSFSRSRLYIIKFRR